MGRYEGTNVFLGRRDHGLCHSAVAEVKGRPPMTGRVAGIWTRERSFFIGQIWEPKFYREFSGAGRTTLSAFYLRLLNLDKCLVQGIPPLHLILETKSEPYYLRRRRRS